MSRRVSDGYILRTVEYEERGALNPDSHAWRDQLVLISAPSSEDGRYTRQRSLLEGTEQGFRERDQLRGDLFEEQSGEFDGGPVPPGDTAAARERFGVEPGRFVALLVGKDGKIKHRSREPVEPAELYCMVGAMPMRRGMREPGA